MYHMEMEKALRHIYWTGKDLVLDDTIFFRRMERLKMSNRIVALCISKRGSDMNRMMTLGDLKRPKFPTIFLIVHEG